ncbi:Sulfite reductase [NADPH] flavoprotein alpha-component [Botrimarina colliarenosi]|uniref:assimilatory sulfite reductase (NADPH) n=1 Tax=Botrimarina colliarenosi TaxID=2528001 RepID=A0A5C6ADT9_9BACT|nr:sulfite reductase subunit alpha [Botrimarina colliarenosi]TWT97576.1 Sulfite reductase [NADPH] flavoprotein alpha-component [Botrimarina colliarenosi]
MSVSIIPESAPFNAEQRAWLNGFLAGWTGVHPGGAAAAPSGDGGVATLPAPAEAEEDFPWHDPGLPIDDRLALADGKPVKRRLMAAMAQLDCGACGYVCKSYSEAIAAGEEKNLTLCSPGGKETAKTLKRLLKEEPAGQPSANGSGVNGAIAAKPTGYGRSNPYEAVLKAGYNLNGDGSSKHTSHVVIDLGESGLTYEAGDSLGVYPTNCPELVEEILGQLGLAGDAALGKRLIDEFNLRDASDELLELLAASATDPDEELATASLIDADELDTLDVLDVLRRAPSATITADDFVACLTEMAPRLYSIASSLKAHPGEVHLTVGKATTRAGDRLYKGVASTMFADRMSAGSKVRVFVQPSHGFSVPANGGSPMIMVGPGTGIAPFRAFLEERQATGATGMNWLFFGDQHEACDFIYKDELSAMQSSGLLTNLSTAFSRDQEEKIYVQDRMREAGAELWEWLEGGASFYVCGDAKRMATDVDSALHDVIERHGGKNASEVKAYIDKLKETGRYARDVY